MGRPFTYKNRNLRLRKCWNHMKERCYKPSVWCYHNYGGRGIAICPEWLNDFDAFADWAMANGYADTLQIDRIDNDGNYEPSNCRWVTLKQNRWNRPGWRKGSTGVHPCHGRFQARIFWDGKLRHLGMFATEEQAAAAYDAAAVKRSGGFAWTNKADGSVTICQGVGNFRNRWLVSGPDRRHFWSFGEAASFAVSQGASGEWSRSESDGRIIFTDAKRQVGAA